MTAAETVVQWLRARTEEPACQLLTRAVPGQVVPLFEALFSLKMETLTGPLHGGVNGLTELLYVKCLERCT